MKVNTAFQTTLKPFISFGDSQKSNKNTVAASENHLKKSQNNQPGFVLTKENGRSGGSIGFDNNNGILPTRMPKSFG